MVHITDDEALSGKVRPAVTIRVSTEPVNPADPADGTRLRLVDVASQVHVVTVELSRGDLASLLSGGEAAVPGWLPDGALGQVLGMQRSEVVVDVIDDQPQQPFLTWLGQAQDSLRDFGVVGGVWAMHNDGVARVAFHLYRAASMSSEAVRDATEAVVSLARSRGVLLSDRPWSWP